jgi:hypothetical protein
MSAVDSQGFTLARAFDGAFSRPRSSRLIQRGAAFVPSPAA